MEEKDLKQIKDVFHEEFGQVWEHNLAPAFDEIEKRFVKIESQMVTKSYLDDKLADLSGNLVIRLRKEDDKVNRIIDILKRYKVVPLNELQELDEFQVFPKIS